jgi:hypothetical protein
MSAFFARPALQSGHSPLCRKLSLWARSCRSLRLDRRSGQGRLCRSRGRLPLDYSPRVEILVLRTQDHIPKTSHKFCEGGSKREGVPSRRCPPSASSRPGLHTLFILGFCQWVRIGGLESTFGTLIRPSGYFPSMSWMPENVTVRLLRCKQNDPMRHMMAPSASSAA